MAPRRRHRLCARGRPARRRARRRVGLAALAPCCLNLSRKHQATAPWSQSACPNGWRPNRCGGAPMAMAWPRARARRRRRRDDGGSGAATPGGRAPGATRTPATRGWRCRPRRPTMMPRTAPTARRVTRGGGRRDAAARVRDRADLSAVGDGQGAGDDEDTDAETARARQRLPPPPPQPTPTAAATGCDDLFESPAGTGTTQPWPRIRSTHLATSTIWLRGHPGAGRDHHANLPHCSAPAGLRTPEGRAAAGGEGRGRWKPAVPANSGRVD